MFRLRQRKPKISAKNMTLIRMDYWSLFCYYADISIRHENFRRHQLAEEAAQLALIYFLKLSFPEDFS